jgi:hypothetical protein
MVRPQHSHTGLPFPRVGAPAVPSGGNGLDRPETQLWRACSELSRRLRCGETCSAEQFLVEFPTLAERDELALDLICTEFRLRRELGQCPDPAAWYARFPRWRERLSRQLEAPPSPAEKTPTAMPTVAEVRYVAPAGAGAAAAPPRYELLQELGHGGMGVVYRARDAVLDRLVAIKMVRAGAATADGLVRFRREAQAVARLRHRHIVALHDFGEHAGAPFLVMTHVGGGNLAGRLADFRDPRAAATLVEKVARAVEAAHQAGIVHRDLKPANILLDEEGEPLVSDFGLAKFLDPEPGEEPTYTGQLVGTPAYMAPEQAAGLGHRATPATDVWALGVILYELLTGRKPFRGQGPEVTPRIQNEAPAGPRSLRPALDRSLEAIVLKCLEKEPGRRYASAGALADDLGRWLRGQPALARPEGWARRGWRLLRQHARAGAVVVLLGCLLAVPPVARWVKDPDRPLRGIQRQLAAGQAATLIGETGPPRWHRWGEGKDVAGTSDAPDRPFSFSTIDIGLLELLPDPQLGCYRFRAEVRHDFDGDGGEVGIYFMDAGYATPRGIQHCFWELTFNDLQGRADPRAGQGAEAGNRVVLHCRRYGAGGAVPVFNDRTAPGPRRRFAAAEPFTGPQAWRKLAIEVTRTKVRAFWEGELVGEIARADVERITREMAARHDPLDLSGRPVPGTALGLFVFNSTAAFRSVVIEPLREEE